jgi:hypothetical protein
VKFSVKRLGFISNPLVCSDWLCDRELGAMAMKYSFIDILHKGDANFVASLPLRERLSNNGQGTEINQNFGYARSGLLNLVPLKQRSGRYRLESALPI